MDIKNNQPPKHKFELEQHVSTTRDNLPPIMQIIARPEGCCRHHISPVYVCEHGGAQWLVCESIINPLTHETKEKLN